MIYHIYWGTAGNSGLYLDEIYQTLKKAGFEQRAFVNYYYPFDYGEKVFFRYGDVGHSKMTGKVRRVVQLFEIIWGYIKILLYACKEKPEVVNYSHASKSYMFINWFIRILRKVSGATVVVTCHDVLPFTETTGEMSMRGKIFQSADRLLVHTKTASNELVEYFNVDPKTIIIHPFPIMDLSKISKVKNNDIKKDTDFLFIGHLRKAKGIELLLESWIDFHQQCPDATLKVCGQKLPGTVFDENELAKYNIEFHLHFISDDDYEGFVRSTRYVVLPYLKGTNSGVISTVLSLGTEVITSDLPMFSDNHLVPKDAMFKTGNKDSLVQLLVSKYHDSVKSGVEALQAYRQKFDEEVINVYESLKV